MRPAGRFVAPDDGGDGRTYLAIAAGSGITPVMGLIRHVLAREPNSRFTLVYGNRTVDSIIFREALNDLKDRYLGRLSVLHVLSRDTEADLPLLSGRIDGDKVKALLPLIGPAADIDHVYLCGPGNLIKDAREALLDAGVSRERIHFEYFRAGPELGATPYTRSQAGAGRARGGGRGRRRGRWRATHLPSSGGRPRRGRGPQRRNPRAVLVQGRHVLHMPGQARRGRGSDAAQLLA